MGLTGRESVCPPMSSQDEPQLKYNYRFKLEAKMPDKFDDEASRSEVQSYINELLGVREKPRDGSRSVTT